MHWCCWFESLKNVSVVIAWFFIRNCVIRTALSNQFIMHESEIKYEFKRSKISSPSNLLFTWVQRFLIKFLVSYRYCFLCVLPRFSWRKLENKTLFNYLSGVGNDVSVPGNSLQLLWKHKIIPRHRNHEQFVTLL